MSENKLKALLQGILISLALTALTFAFFAFLYLDLDPSNWDKAGRAFLVMIWIPVWVLPNLILVSAAD